MRLVEVLVDLGTGIAIAGTAIPAAAVIMTAIKVQGYKATQKADGGITCPMHSGMAAMVDEIRKDVKELLSRR